MVEKFQLLQTAHEVLSDPSKRATYDRTRGATGRATAAYTRTSTTTSSTTSSTPKTRYGRQNTGSNGFSKTTPNSSKPAFGYFTTREPPSSPGSRKTGPTAGAGGAARSPPHANQTGGFAKATRPGTTRTSPQKEKADAYFGRFREKTTTSSTSSSTSWQRFSSAHTPRATPQSKAQQRKEEAQRAAGVKTPKRPGPTKFGTTFQPESEEESAESEEDTFFSFSSNGGSFNGVDGKKEQSWSERRSAYSHVFTGVKEDLRSPSKPKPATGFTFETKSTGFASDGFKLPPKGTAESTTNGLGGGFAKETTKTSEAPPLFANGPARRKSSQTRPSSSSSTPPPPINPKEIPKTPPPVEERRFASAFSRLNVNTSPNKASPPKPKETFNIDDWTKTFEGMNPFASPETKKLSEDPKFWSSVPLKATPTPARRVPIRGIKVKRAGGLGDMSDMKKELPKTDGGIRLNGVGVTPVFATFKVDIPYGQNPSFATPPPPTVFGGMATSQPSTLTTPLETTQQPTPASTPLFNPPLSPRRPSVQCIPQLHPPTPPKQLIPRPSNPKEFSFSVPPKAEMQSLAAQVQAYHIAYIAERSRFEEALKSYEEHINFTDEQIVRTYLQFKEELIWKRTEMEALHTLCLERWGSVAKFAGFTG